MWSAPLSCYFVSLEARISSSAPYSRTKKEHNVETWYVTVLRWRLGSTTDLSSVPGPVISSFFFLLSILLHWSLYYFLYGRGWTGAFPPFHVETKSSFRKFFFLILSRERQFPETKQFYLKTLGSSPVLWQLGKRVVSTVLGVLFLVVF